MGASQSIAAMPKPNKAIHIERMLDSNCDYIKSATRNQILVGLCNGLSNDKNPMNNQCIKIGEDDPLSLMAFNECGTTLSYTFEKDTYLTVAKRDNATGDLYYHLKTPTYDVTRPINPTLRKIYKPIGSNGSTLTLELDKLGKLFGEQENKNRNSI